MAASRAEVEAFIASGDVDERAAEALRSATPQVQRAVIDRGPLSETRNPSPAIMGRLRDAQRGTKPGGEKAASWGGSGFGGGGGYGGGYGGGDSWGGSWGGSGKGGGYGAAGKGGYGGASTTSKHTPSRSKDIESFMVDNNLDDRACEALASCSPAVQKAVMARGDVKDLRNPSSAVLGSLKQAKMECQTSGGSATPEEVEVFIMENELDERATEAMRDCTPEVARQVIDRGELKSAGNPSGAVMGRLRDAQSGKGGKGGKGGMGGKGAGGYEGGYGGGYGGDDYGDSWGGMGMKGGKGGMMKMMQMMMMMKGKGKGKGMFPY